MKKILIFCTAALIALASQSCTAAFHASHRHPGHRPSRVEVYVGNHPSHKYQKKHYKKYRKNARKTYGRSLYGMHSHKPEPPRRPEHPRRQEPPRRR